MNNGKFKTQLSSKKCTRSETTSKKPNSSCFQRSLNRCKSYWMNPNISNNSYSTKLEEPSCWITLRAETASWMLENNILTIWVQILKNGITLSTSTVTSTTLESKRMMTTTESSSSERSSTGRCWLIIFHFSRVKWEI